MPTQSHAGEKQSTRPNAAKDRAAAVREPAAAASGAGLAAAVALGLTRDAWLTQQRSQLSDPRFSLVQRQAQITRYAAVGGNQSVQELLRTRWDNRTETVPDFATEAAANTVFASTTDNGGTPVSINKAVNGEDRGNALAEIAAPASPVAEPGFQTVTTGQSSKQGVAATKVNDEQFEFAKANRPSFGVMTHAAQHRKAQVKVIQRQANSEQNQATQLADEVFDALAGFNNEMRAIHALENRSPQLRAELVQRFQERHGQRLQDYLKSQLDGQWLVRAFALLDSDNVHEYHTAMAMALIPVGTRDEEIFRILYQLPLQGRQLMGQRYDRAFREIGNGSLKADLEDDLSGWRKQKSIALLHHDLTSAEELYFDSAAIAGTHTDAVISRIQSEWDRGPQSFATFEHNWDHYVRNLGNWTTDEAWTTNTLYQTLDEELSGEAWELVKAVLDGYNAFKNGVAIEVGPLSEQQAFRLEEIQLQVARDTLTAATTGGYTGMGTNASQVYRAVEAMRRVWEGRISRAEGMHNEPLAQQYRDQWATERQRLLAPSSQIQSDMDRDSVEYRHTRLILLGQLTPADEVYLASQALDDQRVVQLVTTYWGQGQMNRLLAQTQEPRHDAAGGEVRPAYDITFVIPVTSGITFSRVATLTRSDLADAERGARRLRLELDEGDNDSDLRRGYDFLNAANADLRAQVVSSFAGQYLGDIPGDPTTKFLNYVADRYQNSPTVWEFRDRLTPTMDPQELLNRARGRTSASMTTLTTAYDIISGEETQQVAQESFDRLQFIATNFHARPEELQAMMAMAGISRPEDLAGLEYTAFRSRIEEVRQIRRGITEAVATAAELAIEAVLTVATGGAAGAALLVSLSAAVGGMLVREALLGQEYDLLSRENAQQLLLSVVSHGLGSASRGLVPDVLSPERLSALGRGGGFLEGAITEGLGQIGTQTIALGLQGRFPTTDDIAASAITIVGSGLGAGVSRSFAHSIGEHTSDIARLRTTVLSHITANLMTGTAEESANIVRGGVGNLTGADIAQRFALRAGNSVGRGVISGLADFGGQQVARTRRQARQSGGPESGEDQEGRGGRTPIQGEPEVLDAATVNDRHSLTIVVYPDGVVSIILCSPTCGRIRSLLQAAQAQHNLDLGVYLQLTDQIETRLRRNPKDDDARANLRQLAEDINDLLGRITEQRFFGSDTAGGTTTASSASTASSLIVNGRFTDTALQNHYEDYARRKTAVGETPATPEEWARRTGGAARERLRQALGDDWIERSRPPSSPRGEIHIDAGDVRRLRRSLPPYPHGDLAPFPEDADLALGPSEGRDATGEAMQRRYLLEALPHLTAQQRAAFDQAVHDSGDRAIQVRDSSGQIIGSWPVDSIGDSWTVHHVRPLGWGGQDAPLNWAAVPYGVHQELHRWWEALARAIRTDQEAREAQSTGQQVQHIPGTDTGSP